MECKAETGFADRPEEIRETDIGTGAGLFEVQKIGDEFYTFIVDCKDPKACTILLRGASKDVLNEVQAAPTHCSEISIQLIHSTILTDAE